MQKANDFASTLTADSTITIAPEGSDEEFQVTKAFLFEASDWFMTALKEEFKEGQEKRLRFPGYDVDVVKLFIFWIYNGALPDLSKQLDTDEDKDQVNRDQKRALAISIETTLIRLWTFGEAHIIPKLQNDVIDSLIDCTLTINTPWEAIRQAYTLTPPDSVIRRLFLHEARYEYASANSDLEMVPEDLEKLAQIPGFLTDFMDPIRDDLRKEAWEKGDECFKYKAAGNMATEQFKVKERRREPKST